MRILVVCQHYWPEPYYLSDVCEELVRRGHVVHVVTDVPNYPMGYIYEEYKHRNRRKEEKNGVQITRTYTIGRRNNAFFRILNYYSYSISSTLYTLRLSDNYDVVFANETSPIMMTRAATAYSRKWRKKCVLYCMDLWPACLIAGGIKPESLTYRFFGLVSKKLYNRADKILITSKMFRKYLVEENKVPNEIIEYFPQYAPTQFEELPAIEKEKTGFDFVFAGNIGAAQSLNTLIDAAILLDVDAEIRWHIVGDGSELESLQNRVESNKIKNIFFYGRKPVEDMPNFYAVADAMLVFLTSDPFISMTLPGKVQTYMAAGKPILAAANGEIPEIIKEAKCGFCAQAENAKEFADRVREFIGYPDKERLGLNGKKYYAKNFSRNSFMDRLEDILMEIR